MRSGLLFMTLVLIAYNSFGQDRKDLIISLSGGWLNSPYYVKAHAKGFYSLDFDYLLSGRHVLAVDYVAGKHTYYDDVLSNDPDMVSRPDGTNSDAEYRAFSVLYRV